MFLQVKCHAPVLKSKAVCRKDAPTFVRWRFEVFGIEHLTEVSQRRKRCEVSTSTRPEHLNLAGRLLFL